jgi:hypothetical protein
MSEMTGNRAVATTSVKTQIIHDPIPPLTWNDMVAWCDTQWEPKQKRKGVYCKRGKLAEAFCEAQMMIYTSLEVGTSFSDKPVWDDNTRWISVYWVVGRSEGYYIHVERIMRPADQQGSFIRRWAMVGKVYTIQQAILVTTALQTFINSRMD